MTRFDSGKMSDALTHLEHSLSDLWAPEEGVLPKARVCMGNLILLSSAAGRDRAITLLENLQAADSARTLLVIIDPKLPLWAMDADVSARCLRDGDRLLCAERIDLTFGAGAIGRASSIVTSLLMPESPTTLMLLEPAPPMLVSALSHNASRLLIDSDSLGIETSLGIANTSAARLADLSWLRLYPWRNQIAAIFDDPQIRPAVSSIQRIAIRTTPERPSASHLLAGWLASRLHWDLQNYPTVVDQLHQRVIVDISPYAENEANPPQLQSFELEATLGESPVSLLLEQEGHGPLCATRTAEGFGTTTQKILLSERTLSRLVESALEDTTPDTALRQALQAATRLSLS